MHSPKFERVKGYFDKGLWNTTMVRNAVVKHWITAEEFEEITGDKKDVIEEPVDEPIEEEPTEEETEPIEEPTEESEVEDGLVNDNTND